MIWSCSLIFFWEFHSFYCERWAIRYWLFVLESEKTFAYAFNLNGIILLKHDKMLTDTILLIMFSRCVAATKIKCPKVQFGEILHLYASRNQFLIEYNNLNLPSTWSLWSNLLNHIITSKSHGSTAYIQNESAKIVTSEYLKTYWLDDGTGSLWTFLESMDYRWPALFYEPAIVYHHRPMSRPLNRRDRINFESQTQYYPRRNNNRDYFNKNFVRTEHNSTCVRATDSRYTILSKWRNTIEYRESGGRATCASNK